MKLRVRCERRTIVVTFTAEPADVNLTELQDQVAQQFQLDRNTFTLSLNGRDPLTGASACLAEFGIVSGDLIKVILDQSAAPPVQPVASSGAAAADTGQQQHPQSFNSDDIKQNKQDVQKTSHDSNSTSGDVADSSSVTENKTASSPLTATHGMVVMETEGHDHLKDAELNRYLREPMLVRDAVGSCLPPQLLTLYQSAAVRSDADSLVVVLHTLMLETSYQPMNTSGSDDMPDGWRGPGLYKLKYHHPQCEGITFCVTCVPLGKLLAVHGTVGSDVEQKYQVKLKPSEFVSSSNDDKPVFHQLAKLSRLFKDNISYPLLSQGRDNLQLPQIHGLLGLIPEIQLMILSYVGGKDLCRLGRVCKSLQALSSDQLLWRRLYIVEFGKRVNMALSQNWIQLYKEMYIQRREEAARYGPNPTLVVPDFMGMGHPPLPFAPVYPPGVIGGDYDLNPDFRGIGGPFGPGGPMPGPAPLRPRFDPIGPIPGQHFRPGRGGGMFESRSSRSGWGGFGPRFF